MNTNLLSKIRRARGNEDGFSLIDTVITIALTTIISGILVYAVIVMNNVQRDTLMNTNASISASGLINFFSSEVENSKAHSINEETGALKLRASNDKCITYRYDAEELTLAKTVTDANGVFERRSVIAKDMESVTFEEVDGGLKATLDPKSGPTSEITAKTKVLQSSSGGCW